MPNWTENKIICKKELGEKLLTKTKDGYNLDFNKLIPMPKSMNITAGSIERISIANYYLSLDEKKRKSIENKLKSKKIFYDGNYWNRYKSKVNEYINNPDSLKKEEKSFDGKISENKKIYNNLNELGKQYIDNIDKYGYSQWYDWCSEVWGTKWNVEDEVDVEYYPENDEYEIIFNTAWSVPYGIVEEFSKLCKDGELHWEYINEDYDGHHYLEKENNKIIDKIVYNEDYDSINI